MGTHVNADGVRQMLQNAAKMTLFRSSNNPLGIDPKFTFT